jgi:hypothetical protein
LQEGVEKFGHRIDRSITTYKSLTPTNRVSDQSPRDVS